MKRDQRNVWTCLTVAGALMLAACSGAAGDDGGFGAAGSSGFGGAGGSGGGGCMAPMGQYQLVQQQLAGDCGEFAPMVQPFPVQVPPGCEYQESPLDAACVMQYGRRCDHPAEQYVSESSGVLQWTQDASGASGQADLLGYAYDSTILCQSRYSVSLTRL